MTQNTAVTHKTQQWLMKHSNNSQKRNDHSQNTTSTHKTQQMTITITLVYIPQSIIGTVVQLQYGGPEVQITKANRKTQQHLTKHNNDWQNTTVTLKNPTVTHRTQQWLTKNNNNTKHNNNSQNTTITQNSTITHNTQLHKTQQSLTKHNNYTQINNNSQNTTWTHKTQESLTKHNVNISTILEESGWNRLCVNELNLSHNRPYDHILCKNYANSAQHHIIND